MNNGYNYYPTGGYYGGGMYQQAKPLNMTQGLSPEQLKSLRKTNGFSLDISEDELWRSFCTHRSDNKFSVTQDEEGNMICTLCGTKFKPFEGSVQEARDAVETVVNIMETAKMQSLTLPPKTIQDFFQIEPVLKRLPDLYSQSMNDYKRALGMNDTYVYGQENNAFMMYQNIVNPMAGNGFYDPAMMNMQQPVYGAAPMMQQQPMYGYPQQQMYAQNPMMGQGYQPYQMDGQQMQQGNPFNVNGAPVNNTVNNQQQQAETITVTKTMKD